MNDDELVKIIQGHVDDGIGSDGGELAKVREKILDRYMGELYGNELEGQSKVVSREVMETIEWALPAVMRVFAGSSKVAEFQPDGPEDEEAAEQETEAINYVYNKDNNGFVTTYIIAKAALMYPNSYVKVYREETDEVKTERYKNVNDQELVLINTNPELEIVAADISEDGLYELEVKRTSKRGKVKVDPLPEDEVVVDSNWATLSLDGCPFTCHYPEKTHSELLLMGYDEAELDLAYSNESDSAEDINRRTYSDERNDDDETHKALRKYRYHECNMLVDYDGDGIAERRRVVMIGNKIFENEETDEQPMESAAAILMPHSHICLSYAQTIIDLQDIKTTVWRQLMTNMYRANNPRTLIKKGANLGDLLANRANGLVRIKNDGDVQSEPTTPIIGQVIPLLDLLDQAKEMRSGVTRNGMGLDADILAKSTEGAFLGALEKADQRIEMLVRTLAETVFKSIFLKIHALTMKHGDTKFIKTGGQWVPINPSEWKTRESMTVKVGLGTGDTRQKMFAAKMIIQEQDKLIASGGMDVMVSKQNVYNAKKLLTEAAGEVNADKYFMNPKLTPPPPPQEPPPDPNMLMIMSNERIEQGKIQQKYAELQQNGQYKAAMMQLDAQKAADDRRFSEIELRYNQQIDSLKAEIAQSKNNDDAENKELQNQLKALQVQLEDAQTDQKLAMDKYKADLQAETQLALKRMDQEDTAAPVIQANQESVQATQQMINESIEALSRVMMQQNQPKEIVFDDEGSPIGVRNVGTGEVKSIVKNDAGLPVGLE